MNKLVLALATVAAFGLSTAAFAANPAASTSTTSTPNQVTQSKAPAPKMRGIHRAGAKKHIVHRKVAHARHHRNDHAKRIAVKHVPAKKTTSMKTAS
jgi:hypothetical protein